LVLDGLSVGYGQRVVLSNLNLQLARGSFTALLGANGSGKTTLLKTIVGILKPLAGDVAFRSEDRRQALLGYVPQRESLDPLFLLSAFEVAVMGTFGRVGAARLVHRAERDFVWGCLRAVGAKDIAHRRFAELSGGQRQRVLIARALATRPRFLALDEPTAGLDAAAAQAVMEVLCRVHREEAYTILLVTHDLAAVRQSVPRVLWLHHGALHHGEVSEMLAPERVNDLLEMTWS
jgi:ABC-type Mn2+/Zn2+ transport system ATPase subunit